MSLTFDGVLGEVAVDDFLRNTWGRTFALLPGSAGRFRELLGWPEVNAMLQRHRLEPPRLRLVRNGEFAPARSYLRYEGRVPFIVPERLSAHLRDGYTLIIDAVDDMAPGVMALAEDFERVLHESVQVNLYAGWREQQGFHRHCDTHDVVVLQVYGRKYWRVYEGGRPHPLKDDVAPNDVKPEKVVWEGELREGDVLYLPRGWWHEASGVGDVTLHLTFGIHQRTGMHLLHWLADRSRESEAFRADLLRFGNETERQSQLAQLRDWVMKELDDGIVDRYLASVDQRARTRGWANLPWSVSGEEIPGTALVSLAVPRPFESRENGESVVITANGREWRFAAAAEPLLERLRQGPATVDALCAAARGTDAAAVRSLIGELARQGLMRIDEGAA